MNKGIVYILLSSIAFLIVNIFVKILGSGTEQPFFSELQNYPISELILFRCIITFIICFAIIKVKRIPFFGSNKKWLIIRGLFGTVALTLFFFTLQNLPLAIATTVQYLSPMFTVIVATFLLKERVKRIQWFMMCFALLGVALLGFSKLLSENPDVSTINPYWLLAGVTSAFLSGIAYSAIVKCRSTDHPVTIVMYFPLIATPIMIMYLLFFENFIIPIGIEWLLVLIIGIFTHIAQMLMTKALHLEQTATVIPFKYLGSIYAILVGFFIFDERVSIYGIFAIVVILIGVIGNSMVKKGKRRNLA